MEAPLTEPADHKLELRQLRPDDFPAVSQIMKRVYARVDMRTDEASYLEQLNAFPEGQFGIENHGVIVAAAFSVVVDYDRFGDHHTYEEITGDSSLATHDPDGDVLYGVDVIVHPDHQGMRLGRRLYEARKELCRNLNLTAIVAGGRIPGYAEHADRLSPQEYIEQVRRKELYDPILSFQLSNDFDVKRLIRGYLPQDDKSHGYATLLEWNNLYFDPEKQPLIGASATAARIGCVQWQMRSLGSIEALLQQAEYFVDALSDYQCDLALFPEFFNAPLMGLGEHETSSDAIRALAAFSPAIVEGMSRLAVSYNINIIVGSMPVLEGDELFNIAYLCHRNGEIEEQRKIHPTPHEARHWIMSGGDALQVFETDFGRIGILICYDAEFPELGRLLADEDMQILFVPFWTDTKNGYLRVRYCAQARAIENECYVAIAGSVGNLPKVDSADIQYAQSAVFSPSDFAFPHDAIMAESTPNTEMTLIVDLDYTKLDKLRNEGSVRNLNDRRRDLYSIDWKGK
jgi:predicted amidohydrolase/GNAT superfamily N-acetyltransferase